MSETITKVQQTNKKQFIVAMLNLLTLGIGLEKLKKIIRNVIGARKLGLVL